ncbi:serine hydrolase [Streptomyces sp. GXMU-J15]|uniref:Serine hydrolase n=1 Tax=Streptomyces fuscus TaxID=3048495 RepID=A0ABT7J7L8_9ACTN|nr:MULTISPECIES: serine hydrolase [Streptomyces]MDL2080871.1 serine hydrolase [Streptomyces fuscus]SBT91067.1 CubicO group peptidase, beta-lactamase class C family [Streptomyces sp. DI166]
MTTRALLTSTPAAQGVDSSRVHAFLDALESDPDIEPHSLMILRHDHLVAAGWWAPCAPDRPQLLYSLSKSFTSTAAGFAVAEGLMSLDDPVISYFPEYDAEVTDPRTRAMLVRHVASMASGHEDETLDRARAIDPDDLVHGFLLLPPDRDPGTVFAYNQPATFTLAAIVQRVTGRTLTDYLRPRLFDPIGIGEVAWLRDRAGRELGFSGLHATTDAIARLGQLYLRGGTWDGRQVLPRSWVAEASRVHTPNADGPMAGADWRQGYGLQFWKSRHGYRGDGAYGQYCLVLPEQDAVIALTSATVEMQRVLDLVWTHLLPACGPDPLTGRERADAALAERLAALALPPAPGKHAPEPWTAVSFGSDWVSAEVDTAPDGYRLTLVEDGHRIDLRLVPGEWTVTEEPVPTAVSGGWSDADTLEAEVLFLETPHRLAVTCSLPDRTCTARWRTVPLHPRPLRRTGAPRRSL